MYCAERSWDWYNIDTYRRFISHLNSKGVKMQKFPLCIKETGGMYQRGKDKTQFAESLAQETDPNAAAYTIKLNDEIIKIIRQFNPTALA